MQHRTRLCWSVYTQRGHLLAPVRGRVSGQFPVERGSVHGHWPLPAPALPTYRPEKDIQHVVRLIAGQAHIVQPGTSLSIITADPDDNRILECAAAGKAGLIVSNDHHLLDLKTYEKVPIAAGPDFRRTLGLR
jgi:hypothetical protein